MICYLWGQFQLNWIPPFLHFCQKVGICNGDRGQYDGGDLKYHRFFDAHKIGNVLHQSQFSLRRFISEVFRIALFSFPPRYDINNFRQLVIISITTWKTQGIEPPDYINQIISATIIVKLRVSNVYRKTLHSGLHNQGFFLAGIIESV